MLDSSEPAIIAQLPSGAPRSRHRPMPCAADTPVCTRENGDGNFEPHSRPHSCCMCPVVRVPSGGSGAGRGGARFALNSTHGKTYYRPPWEFGYGGSGVLLSRGLLDSISEREWQLCARRLVCGSSDFRLATCVHNLAPRPVVHHRINETEAFMRAALDRPDETALGMNVHFNLFWSTIQKDPMRGPRILEHFARARHPRCPWSMHKLAPRCVPYVYNASRHCLALPPSANDSVLASLKPLVVQWPPQAAGSCF